MVELFKRKMNNRGVTIVEAMIAMAIIVVVSAAAIKCVESFSISSANMVVKNEVSVAAENALEVFKAAENFEEYRRLMLRYVPAAPITSNRNDNGTIYWDSYKIDGYTMSITLKYGFERGVASFDAMVKDTKNRLVIHIEDYRKAWTDPNLPEGGGGGTDEP